MSIKWLSSVCPEGLYIHWPFCKNKCHYCDFISFEKHEDFEKSYHQALLKEIELFAKLLETSNKKIKTIFLGGGSPSLYPLDLLEELIICLKKYFSFDELQEFTIEANPADVTVHHLKLWQKLGINRLSIGVQVLDDQVLKNLNRLQNQEEVFNLMKIAPDYFENISVDLILGLPGVTNQAWENTLEKVISWPIKHLSVYFLTVYEKTPLYFRIKNNEVDLLDEDELVSLYERTVLFLKKHGFEQYEISNFAKPGFRSIHNISYWDRRPYKGFGLSASSFDGQHRFINEKNLSLYLKYFDSKNAEKPYHFAEKLTGAQVRLEVLMLGLRQQKGVDLHHVLYLFKDFDQNSFLERVKLLESEGLMKRMGDRLQLTLKGMFVENEVILNLLMGE